MQMCADVTNPTTQDRELRPLEEASAMFPDARRQLLTLTQDAIPAGIPIATRAAE
jgi:hypothetical protein